VGSIQDLGQPRAKRVASLSRFSSARILFSTAATSAEYGASAGLKLEVQNGRMLLLRTGISASILLRLHRISRIDL
jgi:hypothetical protein